MTERIFKSICTAAIAVFLVTVLLIMGVLYNYFSSIEMKRLELETALAAQGVERSGTDYFKNLPIGNYRLTWVGADGEVLFDTASDSSQMENHLQREEIQSALANGKGQSTRYSSTLMERSLYSAQRLSDGSVLRLSVLGSSIFLLLVGMIQPLLIIIIVAAVLSFLLARRLSKRIVEPMNSLDLDKPLENEGYDELAPLFRRIHGQQQQLRRQAQKLENKQKELDTIIGSMEEGMVLLDKDGRIITINNAAKVLLCAKTAAFGDNILSVCRNVELQRAIFNASRGKADTAETVLNEKNIRISTAPIISENGNIGVAAVLFDVTVQEQAEQQRREFTANVSHELKTPLQVISGYSELLKCGIAKNADVQPFAEKIYSETQRLISLVEDIINLSQLDEGEKDESPVTLDLYNEADTAVQELRSFADDHEVALSLTGGHAVINAIPKLVHAIIYNLCDNAIKYNHPGGTVEVSVGESEGCASVTVRDTGIGIAPEERDRIFERFYRVDKSRSKAVGGTGLGLSIVKHAARLNNAKIDIDSTLGVGTTITVSFPRE